jgi:hypothetical protein
MDKGHACFFILFVAASTVRYVESKPFNETLKPSEWKSIRLENGRTSFVSPTGVSHRNINPLKKKTKTSSSSINKFSEFNQ